MPVIRSDNYYFPRGDLVLQIESVIFRLHRDILEVHSGFFRDMLTMPTSDVTEGASDDTPLRLPRDLCSAESFTMLCRFIYPMEVGELPRIEVKQLYIWEPVLEATLALQMPSIQRYILTKFEEDSDNIASEPVNLLSWAMRSDTALESLKLECFQTLAYRRLSLSPVEGDILGARTATLVMYVRERIRCLFISSDSLQRDILPNSMCGMRSACQKKIFQQIVKNLTMDPLALHLKDGIPDKTDIFQIDSGDNYCYECGPTICDIARSLRQVKLDNEIRRCIEGLKSLGAGK